MECLIRPSMLKGVVDSVPSKSCAHRVLIAAALAGGGSQIGPLGSSDDVLATIACLRALGFQIQVDAKGWAVVDSASETPVSAPILPCRESGSTLRFLLPVASVVAGDAVFTAEGRLPQRPLDVFLRQLTAHGMALPTGDSFPLQIGGRLSAGDYSLRGDLSSQYFTGLFFALPLLDGTSRIRLESPLQSAGYAALTRNILSDFGVKILEEEQGFLIPGGQRYCPVSRYEVEGDWSSASFWLAARAIGHDVCVRGLRSDSVQADRAVEDVLKRMAHEDTIDVSQIPDAMPILCIVAAYQSGVTCFTGAKRLRYKESDRLAAMADIVTRLGAKVEESEDSLTVHGTGGSMHGGTFDSLGDHRLAMSLAIAGTVAHEPIRILRAECVAKSYPAFYEVLRAVGGMVEKKV